MFNRAKKEDEQVEKTPEPKKEEVGVDKLAALREWAEQKMGEGGAWRRTMPDVLAKIDSL